MSTTLQIGAAVSPLFSLETIMNMKRTQSTFLVQVPSSSEEGKSIKLRKDLGPLKRSEAKAIYLKSSRKISPMN